jgi:opacity protein-like surface antigen
MRLYARWWLIVMVSAAGGSHACWAADTGAIRGYLGLRVGGPPVFSHANKDSAITLENPGAEALGGAVLGVNFDKHWGVELAGEREKTGLTQESTGRKTAEYAWYTLLAQVRWRYPLLEDRLTPYLLAGVGARFTQVETKDSDSPVNFASDEVFCASTGTGLEYFVMSNVAVGIELKYLFGSDSTIHVSGRARDLNIDAFIYTFGLRIFYPEH